MSFRKGDKVRVSVDGPTIEVLAASERLAICGWTQDGISREEVFELAKLRRIVVQQAQQPQQPAPDEDKAA
jgi:uncharacterized protein YodC (DUF2158 family)